jgi:hypothetical protein
LKNRRRRKKSASFASRYLVAFSLGAAAIVLQSAVRAQTVEPDQSRQADQLDELARAWYRQWNAAQDAETLNKACDAWKRAVSLRGSAPSKEQLRSLSALAQCQLAQGQSIKAWESIDRACQISEGSGLKLDDVDLIERRETVRRMLPLVTLRIPPEAAVPGLVVSTPAGPLASDSFEDLIVEGEEQLTISAEGYVTQTLTIQGATGGAPKVYEVPVLTAEPPGPHPGSHSSTSFGVGGVIGVLGGVSVGAGLMIVGGTALYKTGVNNLACDDGCSRDWSEAKENATGIQNVGWWMGGIGLGVSIVGFGIEVISHSADSEDGEGTSASKAVQRTPLAITPLIGPGAAGIQLGGAF